MDVAAYDAFSTKQKQTLVQEVIQQRERVVATGLDAIAATQIHTVHGR